MKRLLALLFGVWSGAPLAASGPGEVFDIWAQAEGAEVTAIAVLENGDATFTRDADTTFDLASNSKAITALCILTLVEDGTLGWDTTLTDALDQEAPPATLADLVTHSAGINRDSTQLRMGFWLNEDQPRHTHVTEIVLNRSSQRGTRGEFRYSNENYALLGRIVEMATGQSYEDACRTRVLEPAGVSGALSPRFAAYAAWGGWRMTMSDHAALLWHWFGPEGRVGRDPFALPHVQRAEGSYYGLGMNYVEDGDGLRMSHAGAISIPFEPKTGAYAVLYPFGAVAAMSYDVAVAEPSRFQALSDGLDEVLRAR
jgi:CubicO group peptidase (beta-lactamase class C family)